MKQHSFKRLHNMSNVIANVICKLGCVKRAVNKFPLYSLGMFACVSAALAPAAAHAEDATARAILNSTHLLSFVSGVEPAAVPVVIKALESGEIRRIDSSFPVWVIGSDTGTVLYYQGQPAFKGQAASRLVDDAGFRFGLRAVDMARNSRSTWVKLQLGGGTYSAYCATKAPFVVCSLVQ